MPHPSCLPAGTPSLQGTPGPGAGHAMEQTPLLMRHSSTSGLQGMQALDQSQQHGRDGPGQGHNSIGSGQEFHTPSDLGASPGGGDEEDDMMVSTPQT
jgi:hypothetical protein